MVWLNFSEFLHVVPSLEGEPLKAVVVEVGFSGWMSLNQQYQIRVCS